MKTTVNTVRKITKKCVNSPYFYPAFVMGFVLFTKSELYADSANEFIEMDALTESASKMIYAKWVCKLALTCGTGFGLVKSYAGGSIMPLISYGGLGVIANFIPSIIDVIVNIGS